MAKRKKAKKDPNIKLVLIPPVGMGKIDPKVIEAAVIKVRDERLKAQAKK